MTTDNLIIGKRYSVSSNSDCVITDTATGYTLASISAGTQAVIVPISDSITSDNDCVVLPIDEATVMPGAGQGGDGGNDYAVWSGDNNSEVTLNIPDDVDIPISFYERKITKATLNMGGTTKMSNFFYTCNSMVELSVIAPHVEDISYFLWNSKLTSIDWSFPQAVNCDRLCPNNRRVTETRLDLPNATICNYLIFGQSSLTEAWINAPKATKVQAVFGNIPVVTLTFNLASVATFDLTVADPVNNNQLGRLPKLQNLTILEGGLASCTSFNISTSTLLTDESIQNVIDALPDYSGTGTSAVVTFPAGRLTAEQQQVITAKGWTWA